MISSNPMTVSVCLEMIFNLIGGLAIFLLGMKYMSDGVQATAGEKLRKMISMVTDNRIAGCATGTFVTCLIQSSSVTTVMLIGLVNAGVMTLIQSIGVILGADLGTTITAWIVAIKITKYGLIIFGLAAFIYLFSKNERVRFFAMLIMGIGLIFFGLQLMSHGMEPLRSNQQFVALFSRFSPKTFGGVLKCILMGSVVTATVQSSSATIAITITLARAGIIDFNTSIALVLGQNIGTTITAYLASLGMTTNARRVAYAHIFIKILGVGLMAPLFFPYIALLDKIMPESIDIAKRIALSHTIFNSILVIVFLPLAGIFEKCLVRCVKGKSFAERNALTSLDIRLLDSTMLSIEQSRYEIIIMAKINGEMFSALRELISTNSTNSEKVQSIFTNEENLDIMQKEVVVFLTHILTLEITTDIAKEAHLQLRRADEYETVSDYCARLLKLYLRLKNANLSFDEEEQTDLLRMHDLVSAYYNEIVEAHKKRDITILTRARPESDAITYQFREMRARHLEKLSNKRLDPILCTVYPDMLSAYRRTKDHLLNIAEAIAGEK